MTSAAAVRCDYGERARRSTQLVLFELDSISGTNELELSGATRQATRRGPLAPPYQILK